MVDTEAALSSLSRCGHVGEFGLKIDLKIFTKKNGPRKNGPSKKPKKTRNRKVELEK